MHSAIIFTKDFLYSRNFIEQYKDKQTKWQKKSLSWIKLQAREQDRFVKQYIMMKVSYFKSRNNNIFLAIYIEISIEKLE